MFFERTMLVYDADKKWISRLHARSLMKDEENGIGCLLFESLRKYGEKIAQIEVETGKSATFSNLLQRCIRTAIEMRRLGIRKGDVISLCTLNHLNTVVPYFAAIFLGAVVSPIDPSTAPVDNKYLLNIVKPKLIFVSDDNEGVINKIIDELKLDCTVVSFANDGNYKKFDDFIAPKSEQEENEFEPTKCANDKELVAILFSSGTTGLPKGIALPHIYFHRAFLRPDDKELSVAMCCTNIYWITSVFNSLSYIARGFAHVIYKNFDENDVWNIIQKYKINTILVNTTNFAKMLRTVPSNYKSDLKTIYTGGSTISPTNITKFRNALPDVGIGTAYGATEVAIITGFARDEIEQYSKPASSGLPIPGNTVKVVNPDTGETLGFNQSGEIRIKTKYQMVGYYNQDSSDCWDSEGFLKTGDWGYYDEDYCFYITDRIKEMFKFKSWHILPAKLEVILETHPAVKHAAVVGIPHEDDDNHALAIVVLHNNIETTAEDIQKFIEDSVDDRHKLRGGVKFVKDLIYTATGKLKRRELKQLVLNGII